MPIRRLLFCFALLYGVRAHAVEPPASTPLRLLVPDYFYPEGKGLEEWKRLARAAKDAPIVAVANPASGPGSRPDASYTAAIDLARNAGVTVIGYVSTRYAKRPEADVRTDIDRWLQFYPKIDGFFFDEQTSGKKQVPYYEAIAKYVQSRRTDVGALVVTNPGTATSQEYLTPWKGIHVSCLYEDHGGLDRYQRPPWTASVPAAQVAGLVYGEASLARMRENLRLAASKGLGFVYVTDDGGNNPWDRLPTYWELEVAELRHAYLGGLKPGLSTVVSQADTAYDAHQQLGQEGIFTGDQHVPTYVYRFSRLQFGAFLRDMLEQLSAIKPPSSLLLAAKVQRTVKALNALTDEFHFEAELHGITHEAMTATIQSFAARYGLPVKR